MVTHLSGHSPTPCPFLPRGPAAHHWCICTQQEHVLKNEAYSKWLAWALCKKELFSLCLIKQGYKLRQRSESQAVSWKLWYIPVLTGQCSAEGAGKAVKVSECWLPAETKESSHCKEDFKWMTLIGGVLRLPFASGGRRRLPSPAGLAKTDVTEGNVTCKPCFVVHGGVESSVPARTSLVSPPMQGMCCYIYHPTCIASCSSFQMKGGFKLEWMCQLQSPAFMIFTLRFINHYLNSLTCLFKWRTVGLYVFPAEFKWT